LPVAETVKSEIKSSTERAAADQLCTDLGRAVYVFGATLDKDGLPFKKQIAVHKTRYAKSGLSNC